jgi:hypothetical protein
MSLGFERYGLISPTDGALQPIMELSDLDPRICTA